MKFQLNYHNREAYIEIKEKIVSIYALIIMAGDSMKFEDYMKEIERKFVTFFTIQKDAQINGVHIDMFADYSNIVGRTLITKVDIIDYYEIFEKCYFKHYEYLNRDEADKFFEFLKEISDTVTPSEFHRSTDITGVMICDKIDNDMQNHLYKLKHVRYFNYYLKGWVEVRLVLVSLSDMQIYTNPAAKTLKKIYKINNDSSTRAIKKKYKEKQKNVNARN